MATTKKPTTKKVVGKPKARDPIAMQVEAALLSIGNAQECLSTESWQAARSHLNIAVHHVSNVVYDKTRIVGTQGGTV